MIVENCFIYCDRMDYHVENLHGKHVDKFFLVLKMWKKIESPESFQNYQQKGLLF